jgi:hypothetical protein
VERQLDFNKLFYSPHFFLSSPYQSVKVFSHLFFISSLVLIFFIAICFFKIFFWLIFLFNFIFHHLVLFDFYIKSSFHSFDFLNALTNWILFLISSLNIWF